METRCTIQLYSVYVIPTHAKLVPGFWQRMLLRDMRKEDAGAWRSERSELVRRINSARVTFVKARGSIRLRQSFFFLSDLLASDLTANASWINEVIRQRTQTELSVEK